MNFDAQALFELLPAVHRIRDAELARAGGLQRGPLEELISVLAEQIGVAEESLEQLDDDLFIETCADWVVPYIGDLIGYRSLHQVAPSASSARAEVAHTIALRRRKGTALVLEQLARDVTGWDARAVEYFQRLCTTQTMNHTRPHNLQSPDLRAGEALEWIGTAFETANRSVGVRRIESGRGRHNIPNVGLHLWRIQAWPHRESPAAREGLRRYRASPLGHDLPLYNRPRTEDDITHLAEPDNVPWPLSRRRLGTHLARHYGERASAGDPLDNPEPALILTVDGTVIERDRIHICNLADDAGSWAHSPPPDGFYAIDPVLGRVSLPLDAPDPADVRLTWHEGFSAAIGGGEYERGHSLPLPPDTTAVVRVPDEHPTLVAALTAIAGNGVIEITDSSRYEETLAIDIVANGSVEIRAVNGRRPLLVLGGLSISGAANSACTLNGLLVSGAALVVPDAAGNVLGRLNLLHCTLVPGITLNPDGSAEQPVTPSLQLAITGLETEIERCIIGAIRSHERSTVRATDSIIDATARDGVAFAAADDAAPGAALSLIACTVIGKLHTAEVGLISNCILLAALAAADTWAAPVRAARKQTGCVRFSWLPLESIVPARHRCQPDSAAAAQQIAPRFSSLHYGSPPYGQLSTATPAQILRGADDESEMGVFHHLYGAQRVTNLRIRLAEYLRVGLRAGVFHES
ncbi:hypothetical protein ACM26W_17240 [Halomonas sp. HK25]|uniref:hypothetical protein n=1 Tax=Halomonas sp. HK25 TaxID=3394321 RepID=UPI0039FCFE8D